MLVELNVRNLAVIEELRMEFKPGLTILTGEEGAGKSLLADALCLLMGGRASTALVRNGAPAAMVEGVFETSAGNAGLATVLQEAGIELEDDGSLILARELRENGRSVARVNGRAVPASLLQELGQHLMDIHSQLEHVSLLSPQRQLDVLDSYAGLLDRRAVLKNRLGDLRGKTRELSALTDNSGVRRRELLEYQVAEVDGADINPGEDEVLEQERQILQRALTLQEGCHAACNSLYLDDSSAAGLVHEAAKALRGIVSIDAALSPHLEALESAAAEIEETARDLRSYAQAVESRSDQLEHVEKRLELLRHLKSKYGPTLGDVVSFADQARQELESLASLDERQVHLEEECHVLEREVRQLAKELSEARRESARTLSDLVNGELSDLGMPRAKFDVSVISNEFHDGVAASPDKPVCGQYGIDRVGFLGATNPGEPLRPLADIASGGETCRFMLALKSVLRQADPVPTLLFDEIDSGIGGRHAHIVGRKLAALARDRQVICITHLPQIACFGQDHYRVTKEVSSGRASTRTEHLEGNSRLEELAAMLGSHADGPLLDTAHDLLSHAEADKLECATAQR